MLSKESILRIADNVFFDSESPAQMNVLVMRDVGANYKTGGETLPWFHLHAPAI